MKGCAIGIAAVLVSLVLIGVGFVVGNTTYQSPFQSTSGVAAHYVSGDQSDNYTSYLQLQGDATIYVVHEADFTPPFSFNALASSDTVSLVFEPSDGNTVDITATGGLELKGNAATAVAITVASGQQQVQYATQAYSTNPAGFQHDDWSIGRWIVGAGVVVLLVAVWVVLAANGIVITPG